MSYDLVPREEEAEAKNSELNLLQGVLKGDRQCERAFVERFVPVIEACVRRLGRSRRINAHDLEDMVGEVWLSLWENNKHRLRRFDPAREVRVSTWIGALARNRSIDYLRGMHPPAAAAPDQEAVDDSPLPPDTLEQRERAELASRAMERLSDEEREFLCSLCVDEQETAAIAEELGIALATVYSRRFKIAAKLAREVQRIEHDSCVAAA